MLVRDRRVGYFARIRTIWRCGTDICAPGDSSDVTARDRRRGRIFERDGSSIGSDAGILVRCKRVNTVTPSSLDRKSVV